MNLVNQIVDLIIIKKHEIHCPNNNGNGRLKFDFQKSDCPLLKTGLRTHTHLCACYESSYEHANMPYTCKYIAESD